MSSSDGMLMKGKCQGEFGSVLGLEHFIAGHVWYYVGNVTTDTAGYPRADYLIDRQLMRTFLDGSEADIRCFDKIPANGNNIPFQNSSHYSLMSQWIKCDCEHRAEDCTREIKHCSIQMIFLSCVANEWITALCNQQFVLSFGGLKRTTSTNIQNDYLHMYGFWLMALWLLSMELTHSPVNAQLMHFPKGSFVCSHLSLCLEHRLAVTSTPWCWPKTELSWSFEGLQECLWDERQKRKIKYSSFKVYGEITEKEICAFWVYSCAWCICCKQG